MVGCLEWQLTNKYMIKLDFFELQMIENQSQLVHVHVYVGLE